MESYVCFPVSRRYAGCKWWRVLIVPPYDGENLCQTCVKRDSQRVENGAGSRTLIPTLAVVLAAVACVTVAGRFWWQESRRMMQTELLPWKLKPMMELEEREQDRVTSSPRLVQPSSVKLRFPVSGLLFIHPQDQPLD